MPQQNNIYTVKELNERIQELVSGEPWLGSLGVEGEITGLGTDKRGHMYFSLKDPSGVLAAVMFAGKQVYGLKFAPKNGDKVHAFGHIDVFVRDGKYQLYVDRLVRVGGYIISVLIADYSVKKRIVLLISRHLRVKCKIKLILHALSVIELQCKYYLEYPVSYLSSSHIFLSTI